MKNLIKTTALIALFLTTTLSFSQKKEATKNSGNNKEFFEKVIKNNKEANDLFNKWDSKTKEAYLKKFANYSCAFNSDRKRTINGITDLMIKNKLISKSEKIIIVSFFFNKSFKIKYLKSLEKKKYSTETAKFMITTMADNYLKVGDDSKPSDDIAPSSQGFFRNLGTLIGAAIGFGAAGGTSAGVGAVPGGMFGGMVGGAAGGLIDDALGFKDGCGQDKLFPIRF